MYINSFSVKFLLYFLAESLKIVLKHLSSALHRGRLKLCHITQHIMFVIRGAAFDMCHLLTCELTAKRKHVVVVSHSSSVTRSRVDHFGPLDLSGCALWVG